jgi:hypothetical protein
MPDRITDPPPADVANQLAVLSGALDRVVPPKQPGQNLLIGTWNVGGFDRLTPKWRSVAGDSPIRDLSNLLCSPRWCAASTSSPCRRSAEAPRRS